MRIPNVETAINFVVGLIAAGTKLVVDRSLVTEPAMPEGPDRAAALFEVGGNWADESNGSQDWTLLFVARAATLKEARLLMVTSIDAVMTGALKAQRPMAGGFKRIRLHNLWKLRGRDEKDRVILEQTFVMSITADGYFGAEQNA